MQYCYSCKKLVNTYQIESRPSENEKFIQIIEYCEECRSYLMMHIERVKNEKFN